MMKRIGIFAGSFDPVHKGHVAFALQALEKAKLDDIYFLPEIQPRGKTGITHIGHRVAMLNLALNPYPYLHVLELPDKQFSVAKTLPRLLQKFEGDKLFLLVGSDVLANMSSWPNVSNLLENVGLAIARREINENLTLPKVSKEVYQINSPEPTISSSIIRGAIQNGKRSIGLVPSVQKYIDQNWIYSVAVPKSSA